MTVVVNRTERLTELEAVIDDGLQTFVKVGNALAEIRDSKLYRDTYATFEAYCAERHGLKRQRAYEIMEAAEVVSTLSEISDKPGPSKEAHAAELAPLKDDPEAMAAAWDQVQTESNGKPTALDVERVVQQVKPRSAKPARPVSPTRKSVTSGAVAADSQEIPDDTYLGSQDVPANDSQDTGGFDVNNEARRGGPPSLWCSFCDLRTHRIDDCPHKPAADAPAERPGDLVIDDAAGSECASASESVPPADSLLTDRGGDGEADTAVPASVASHPATVTPDRPGTAAPEGDPSCAPVAAEDAVPTASEQPAAPATLDQPNANRSQSPAQSAPKVNGHASFSDGLGKSAGSKAKGSSGSDREVGWHPVVVDGKAPVPVYPTAEGHINSVESHLTGETFDEFDRLYQDYRRRVFKARRLAAGEPEPETTARKPAEIVSDIKALPIGLQRSVVSQVIEILEAFPADQRLLFAPRLRNILTAVEEGPDAVGLSRLVGAR